MRLLHYRFPVNSFADAASFWIHRTSWPWPCGFFHYASLRYNKVEERMFWSAAVVVWWHIYVLGPVRARCATIQISSICNKEEEDIVQDEVEEVILQPSKNE